MREFIKHLFFVFVVCHFFISLAVATTGLLLSPQSVLGYEAFYMPVLLAFLCTLPSFFIYSRHELSVKETLFRKFLQIVADEAIVLSILKFLNPTITISDGIVLGIAVIAVYASVWVVLWFKAKSDADTLNKMLSARK